MKMTHNNQKYSEAPKGLSATTSSGCASDLQRPIPAGAFIKKQTEVMYVSMKWRGTGKNGIVQAFEVKGLVGLLYVFDTPENALAFDNEDNLLVAIKAVEKKATNFKRAKK